MDPFTFVDKIVNFKFLVELAVYAKQYPFFATVWTIELSGFKDSSSYTGNGQDPVKPLYEWFYEIFMRYVRRFI